MNVDFEQGFLTDIGRIDEKVVIESWEDLNGERRIPHIICQGKKMQVCLVNAPEGNENSILRFYYNGGKLGFMISERTGIYIEKHRTIFEFNLPIEPKAIIESKDLPEDTKILEGLGTELGCSLYKDVSVSSESLVWKESLGKYAVDRGLQDKHSYDVELLDTKSGQLEERPIRFKSYTGITVDQGNWEIETIKTTVLVKHDVYSEISDSTFLVWDSPMIDAKVDLEVEPVCINNIGKYLDPLNVVFGNTDCFQFTNYGSTLRGFRLTGTEGSKVAILFNKESSNGSYTEFECVIGSEGVAEVRIPEDLPYYHFNGIETRGPSRITKIETILNIEESVDQYTPNPDKTYLVRVKNQTCTIEINGYADYIEYEKYLGTITEIGRGRDSITDIPELSIEDISYSGDLHYRVDKIGKQIDVFYNGGTNVELRYTVFQLKIQNNLNVNGNIITTSELDSDYKIKIEQDGFFWKLVTIPDYVNGDDNLNVYVTESDESSYRSISIFTNYTEAQSITPIISEELSEVFNITASTVQRGVKVDGVYGTIFNLAIYTKSRNRETTWRPKDSSGNPFKVGISHTQFSSTGLSFYLIQLREIKPKMEIWEETLPGKYTKIDSSLKIYNSMTKSFVVVEKVTEGSTIPEEDVNWYYYDLVGGQNKFYLTNYSGEVTNSGYIYFVSHDTTLLDIGTGVDRAKYGRLVNVNRSDFIDGLGTLTVTESSEYPESWRNVVDNNTVNAEVERIVDNVYVQVGQSSSDLKNEDLEIEVDSISLFGLYIQCNFKYTVEAHGYLKIYSDGVFVGEVEKFSGYSSKLNWEFGLFRLDEEPEMGETYIEIRSANVVRKVTLKVVDPRNEHNYLYSIPPSGPAVDKPNLIRIFGNGATSPTSSNKFYYKSYTTPSFTSSGVNTFVEDTTTHITDRGYLYHETEIPLYISNSKSLSRSKYPIKSFGYIQESSLSYSDGETYIGDTSLSGPLKYQLYMKGKEHYLWCVDSLSGVSDLVEPEEDVKKNMTIDASGGTAETFYVVSRYSSNNRTFMTETPTSADYKIVRDELEANIKILSQQNIGLDGNTQIEYATPIQVSSNMPNTGGNIFLGKVRFCAKTRITDGSIDDVIEIDEDISTKEGINETYIKDNIVKDKTQYLDIMIFQLGTNPNVLNLVSEIPSLDIFASTHYMIPEVGSNFTITSMTATLSSNTSTGGGDDICRIKSSSYDSGYFLVEVESDDRVGATHWFDSGSLPRGKIVDTEHVLSVKIDYVLNDSSSIGTHTFSNYFTKYGCNIGLYVNGKVGLGVSEEYVANSTSYDAAYTYISEDGGSISIVAGILDARDGVGTTEALHVPEKYEFIGANRPLNYSWVEGNVDGTGNLTIEVPPRARDDKGYKEYILKVTQDHKYYPMSLYIVIAQKPSYGSGPDIDKKGYRLMFLNENKYIYSDGTIEGGDKFYFVSNLTKEDFDNTSFVFEWSDGTYPEEEFYYDNYHFEEISRSYEEGYVQFKFIPNGSRTYVSGKISAIYHNKLSDGSVRADRIGNIHIEQGYYCVEAVYRNPRFESSRGYTVATNYLSRINPVLLKIGYTGEHPRRYYYSWFSSPCKTNKDNSDSSIIYGRGVFKLAAYKREFNKNYESTINISDVFIDSMVDYISPSDTLSSYGLAYVPSSTDDWDAKANPLFNNGYPYATDNNFSIYCPYLELIYENKEDYIREYSVLSASCRLVLKDPDRGGEVNFYFATSGYKNGSDEPLDVETLEFSNYNLKWGYKGGTKQVSYYPAYFGSMMNLSLVESGVGWINAYNQTSSNYVYFTASENKTSEDSKAYYRNTQAKIDVIDSRGGVSTIMKSFYFNLEQEPDIQQTSGGSGGDTPSSGFNIKIKFKNNRSSAVSFTGETSILVSIPFDGSTIHAVLDANLPDTDLRSNSFTVPAGGTSLVYTTTVRTSSEVLPPETFIGGTIEGCTESYYDSSTGERSDNTLEPYSISGEGDKLVRDGSYTITFTNPPT